MEKAKSLSLIYHWNKENSEKDGVIYLENIGEVARNIEGVSFRIGRIPEKYLSIYSSLHENGISEVYLSIVNKKPDYQIPDYQTRYETIELIAMNEKKLEKLTKELDMPFDINKIQFTKELVKYKDW